MTRPRRGAPRATHPHRADRIVLTWLAVAALTASACSAESPASTPGDTAQRAHGTDTSTDGGSASSTTTAGTTAGTAAPTVGPTIPSTTVSPPSPKECLSRWDTAALVGQLVWPAVYPDGVLDDAVRYAEWGVGGAVLMRWPGEATADDLDAFKRAGPVPLLIATDEEGGDVQRLAVLGELPAPATVAATMTPQQAEQMIATHAVAVRQLGVDVVLGPVVDVGPPTGRGPIGNRSFGRDPAVVTLFASAYVKGWQSAGILPVLKHFPGHGAASADTHVGGAQTAPLDQLRRRDLLPYITLAGQGAAVMTGHLDVPGLTDVDGIPASLSRAAITDLLRGELGYGDALVFSDALNMDALAGSRSVPDAAEAAIAAGSDVVVFTTIEDTPDVVEQLRAAVDEGRLSRQQVAASAGRVLARKQVDPCGVG